MEQISELIYQNIVRDASSGLLVLDFQGRITFVNPSAERILCRNANWLQGRTLVQSFFEFESNDKFVQLILDAVYEKDVLKEDVVPFFNGEKNLILYLKTSYLRQGEQRIGVICMMDDITELYELKDAVRAMNEIKRLNESLTLRNQLLYETFGRFLSDDIVKQLLETEDGLALGGKKKNVSVMMSDIRGFTAMSERMSAKDLISMLNHYLAEMTQVIQKRHGTIIEFIGDGIMALFGAPVEQTDHCDNAVLAAVEMQLCMPGINRWNEEHGYPQMEMGIGLHTGDVIVGNIGSEKRTKYGAVGNNVNLAGRIESLTTGGQILISESMCGQISFPLEIAAEQEIYPKGAAKPMRLMQVTGVGEPHCMSFAECIKPQKPVALSRRVKVSFTRFKGKISNGERCEGTVTALSEQEMLLETDEELALHDNLSLRAGGDLYAKVIETRNGAYCLHFTSKPAGFAAWKKETEQK